MDQQRLDSEVKKSVPWCWYCRSVEVGCFDAGLMGSWWKEIDQFRRAKHDKFMPIPYAMNMMNNSSVGFAMATVGLKISTSLERGAIMRIAH